MLAPPELTPLQQARYSGWLLDYTRQRIVERYASNADVMVQLLLAINQTIAAFEYTDEPNRLADGPIAMSDDPELFISLSDLFQEEIDAIHAKEQNQSYSMQPALEWLNASKRYATSCAARLREHHDINPEPPQAAAGSLPIPKQNQKVKTSAPSPTDGADATPESDFATPQTGPMPPADSSQTEPPRPPSSTNRPRRRRPRPPKPE